MLAFFDDDVKSEIFVGYCCLAYDEHILRHFVVVVWIFGMVWIGGLLVQVYCLAVLISGLDLNKLQGLLCRFGYRFV